jgi:hypothetical protein
VLLVIPTGCGNTETLPGVPFFDLSSGVAVTWVNGSSKPCAGVNSTRTLFGTAGVSAPSFTPSSHTTYRFTANWVVTFSAVLKVNPGTAPEPSFASLVVYSESELSNSNGTSVIERISAGIGDVISSGSYSHTFQRIDIPVYLNHTFSQSTGRTWTFATFLSFQISTVAAPGSVSALGAVNIAAGGKECRLLSYTESES